MYIHIYIYIHTYIYIYIHTYIYVYVSTARTHISLSLCICVLNTHIYIYIYLSLRMYVRACVRTYVCRHACMYVCMHVMLRISDRMLLLANSNCPQSQSLLHAQTIPPRSPTWHRRCKAHNARDRRVIEPVRRVVGHPPQATLLRQASHYSQPKNRELLGSR